MGEITALGAALIGAGIGFTAMLVLKGRAGYAAALAILGLALGLLFSLNELFGWVSDSYERAQQGEDVPWADWSTTKLIVAAVAAAPGVLGGLFARRD